MSQYESSSVSASKIESLDQFEDNSKGRLKRWIAEIQYAEKEMDNFWVQGRKVNKRYLDERDDMTATDKRFNIFFANVEIMKSALYAELPKAEVTRKFFDPDDDVSRVAARMLERNLMQDVDEPHCSMDACLRNSVHDLLVPGLGTAWVRMETETEEQTLPEQRDPISGMLIAEAYTYEKVTNQEIYTDYVYWEDFVYSPCRVWEECRWVARKVRMTRDKLKERFGEEIGKKVPLDWNPGYRTGSALEGTSKNEVFQQAVIYEIWDKDSKKVFWVSKSHDDILDEKDDPIGIENFWPCPRPMFSTMSTSRCVPKSDFVLIQDQYNELDIVNNRIQLLIQACKVVGVYDKSASGSVPRMLQEGVENTLVPVDNWAMFAEKGGMKGVIDWLPLEQVIKALERLEKNREDIKQQIYELTGIADIVRGATKASETLGAQEIKAKFASVRIQRKQNTVAEFACDIFKIKAALICKHFPDDIIVKRSNLAHTEDAPFIEAALQLLRDHELSEWLISIKPDSMAQIDYAQERKDRMELAGVVTSFLEKAIPVFQQAPMVAPFFVTVLKFIVSGFRAGKDIESAMDAMLKNVIQAASQPQPPKPDPEMIKAQASVQALQAKTKAGIQAQNAMTGAKIQATQQKAMSDAEISKQKSEMDNLMKLFKLAMEAKESENASE